MNAFNLNILRLKLNIQIVISDVLFYSFTYRKVMQMLSKSIKFAQPESPQKGR